MFQRALISGNGGGTSEPQLLNTRAISGTWPANQGITIPNCQGFLINVTNSGQTYVLWNQKNELWYHPSGSSQETKWVDCELVNDGKDLRISSFWSTTVSTYSGSACLIDNN